MKIKKMLCFAMLAPMIFLVTNSWSASGDDKLARDFEGVGESGVFESHLIPNGLGVRYYSPSLKKTLSYKVENFDECSMMGLYAVPHTNMIAVDGSCSSQGGQIYIYIYKWSGSAKNWCLVRQVNGEKTDITSGTVVPTEDVSRVSGCTLIGSSESPTFESKDQVRREIRDELDVFKKAAQTTPSLEKYITEMPDFQVAELGGYVDASNVEDVNNLAFYLGKYKRPNDSAEILQSVVKKFPDRIVARLNLADAYWGMDAKDLAAAQYQEYKRQMTAKGLAGKIPSRVLSRAK